MPNADSKFVFGLTNVPTRILEFPGLTLSLHRLCLIFPQPPHSPKLVGNVLRAKRCMLRGGLAVSVPLRTMTKTCAGCQYYREPGLVTFSPPSNWCSNMASENYLLAVRKKDNCPGFVNSLSNRKKAGVGVRLLSWVLGKLNWLLRRINA